jgi:deazaflavin-dependent oxidoreductase (nitroreductase family)
MSLFSQTLKVHQALYERTDGLVGHRLLGVPTLLLRTTGARSGLPRTNALVYAKDGDRYLVVASKGGSDQAPGWLHNLRKDPRPEVQLGRRHHRASAAIIGGDDPDYDRVWQIVNEGNSDRFKEYQTRTNRKIPVVALSLLD